QQSLKHLVEAFRRQRPEPVQRAHGGKCRDTLDQKGPGLQKRRPSRDLEGELRRLVVCGTTVMRARSWSPKATLTTSPGRVLPAWPKSISQTSQRLGVAIFLVVKRLPESDRGGTDLFVGKRAGVEGQGAAQDLLGESPLFFRRQVVEGLEQGLGLA